jgi:hypothetical protein
VFYFHISLNFVFYCASHPWQVRIAVAAQQQGVAKL